MLLRNALTQRAPEYISAREKIAVKDLLKSARSLRREARNRPAQALATSPRFAEESAPNTATTAGLSTALTGDPKDILIDLPVTVLIEAVTALRALIKDCQAAALPLLTAQLPVDAETEGLIFPFSRWEHAAALGRDRELIRLAIAVIIEAITALSLWEAGGEIAAENAELIAAEGPAPGTRSDPH